MKDELLEIALSAGGMAVWEIDAGSSAMTASPGLAGMVGLSPGPVTLASFVRCIYPDDQPLFDEALSHAFRGEPMHCQVRIRRADGMLSGVLLAARTARDAAGRPSRVFGVIRRIDERSSDEYPPDPRQSPAAAFDAHSVGMAYIDPTSGMLLRVNQSLAALLGRSKLELVGRRLMSLADPEERAAGWGALQGLLRGDRFTHDAEYRLLHSTGKRVWVRVIVNLMHDAVGVPLQFVALVMGIEEQKQAQAAVASVLAELRVRHDQVAELLARRSAELAGVNAALLAEIADRKRAEDENREVVSRMVQSVEDERRRISRELHDTVGQHLAVVGMQLKAIKLELAGSESALQRLDRLQEALRSMEDQIDRLAHDLRPSALDDLGLEEAMRSHVEMWSSEAGVPCELHTHGLGGERLSPSIENTAYRVMQEALTNVHRHAGAARVSIIVERRPRELRMVVEDDGRGFDAARSDERPSLGLRGMKERAVLVAGTLEVESVPGSGTTVYLVVPLPDVEPADEPADNPADQPAYEPADQASNDDRSG
jgi:PAS domain S-box-containing protein